MSVRTRMAVVAATFVAFTAVGFLAAAVAEAAGRPMASGADSGGSLALVLGLSVAGVLLVAGGVIAVAAKRLRDDD